MTQNGLKWILNITLKTVKFFILTPPKKSSLSLFSILSCVVAMWHTRVLGLKLKFPVNVEQAADNVGLC